MRICRVANSTFFLCHHLNDQIRATVAAGHEVHLIASASSGLGEGRQDLLKLKGVYFHAIDIRREISPIADMCALIALFRYFMRVRFDIVHSVTSKGGLLTAVAGALALVPVRLHTFAGQPWANLTGPVRWIAKACDWLVARLSTRCYADSSAQRRFLQVEGIAPSPRIHVLGAGSIAGVDLRRFSPARFEQAAIKAELLIAEGAKVVTFVGRVSVDKGIVELVEAFERLGLISDIKTILLLVGPFETGRQAVPAETIEAIARNPNIRRIGYSDIPEKYLAVSDVFCLPSYREGFGSVVIEAAAMSVPAVVTGIFGLADAVVNGETGIFVPPYQAEELGRALAKMLTDDSFRLRLGRAAQARASQVFDAKVVNGYQIAEYERLAGK